ncbi:D-alanyl-D-alanine dipeptidase [Parabacteroides sp. PFB2-10]|uniref:M15 family metallopeptidase n=1 Tax=Parabacteroides sp. PFB2-10 TaxID=1742405 RepID=UPI002474D5B9|nr:M15 family metallopeptidase [Parabacteroides sp. PFB2-10]MDH6311501.1 D-alanyl-D-alanine dipeptidase [Parabacteroides sp. PFB2-10]
MRSALLLTILSLFLSSPLSAQKGDSLLAEKGLIDIAALDSTIRVELIYAGSDNFMGEAVYEGITKAWLHPDAAAKLLKAQEKLRQIAPQYRLIVYDAARPMSVQRRMWALVRGTDKTNYVANPANGGGLHNYGMAVDVSLIDQEGNPLPMGTAIDHFGREAHTDDEETLVDEGLITREEAQNRQLLRSVMHQAGFTSIRYEWWHFNACSRPYAREHYMPIE